MKKITSMLVLLIGIQAVSCTTMVAQEGHNNVSVEHNVEHTSTIEAVHVAPSIEFSLQKAQEMAELKFAVKEYKRLLQEKTYELMWERFMSGVTTIGLALIFFALTNYQHKQVHCIDRV